MTAATGEWRQARSDRAIGSVLFGFACAVGVVGMVLAQWPPVLVAGLVAPVAAARVALAQWRLRRRP